MEIDYKWIELSINVLTLTHRSSLCEYVHMHTTFVLRVPLWPAIFEHLSEPNERKSPIYFPLYS